MLLCVVFNAACDVLFNGFFVALCDRSNTRVRNALGRAWTERIRFMLMTMKPEPGVFLVAMPTLQDPTFMRAVVYLLEHSATGTLGLIINRPVPVNLCEIWDECPESMEQTQLCAEGGPVDRNKGLLIHRIPEIPDALELGLGLSVGGDPHLLAAAYDSGKAAGPRLFLGHAGWSPEQLEEEIAQGSWLVRSGLQELLLDPEPPADLWQTLISAGEELPKPSIN